MQRRRGGLVGLVAAGLVLLPLAAAGAQTPTTTGDPDQTVEGSGPPGGDVNCEVAPTLTPDHGPPGTQVTAAAEFTGNCDDSPAFFFALMTCFGQVSGGGIEEPIPFPVDVIIEEQVSVSGTFTAPAVEPDPPVVDAVEQLSVSITCNVLPQQQVSAEGDPPGTTYHYPPAVYALELFADPDGEQPTLVTDDDDVVDPSDPGDPGVVSGSPTFTG